jgi:hypothetical protein
LAISLSYITLHTPPSDKRTHHPQLCGRRRLVPLRRALRGYEVDEAALHLALVQLRQSAVRVCRVLELDVRQPLGLIRVPVAHEMHLWKRRRNHREPVPKLVFTIRDFCIAVRRRTQTSVRFPKGENTVDSSSSVMPYDRLRTNNRPGSGSDSAKFP